MLGLSNPLVTCWSCSPATWTAVNSRETLRNESRHIFHESNCPRTSQRRRRNIVRILLRELSFPLLVMDITKLNANRSAAPRLEFNLKLDVTIAILQVVGCDPT